MKTIEEREKEGYSSISDLNRFLDGLKDGKNSRVYVKVSQRDGHNYLDFYVENNLPKEHPLSGINCIYQYKMNEIGK